MIGAIILQVVLILLNATFSSTEIAVISDVAEQLKVTLPTEYYDTFSGFVCGRRLVNNK